MTFPPVGWRFDDSTAVPEGLALMASDDTRPGLVKIAGTHQGQGRALRVRQVRCANSYDPNMSGTFGPSGSPYIRLRRGESPARVTARTASRVGRRGSFPAVRVGVSLALYRRYRPETFAEVIGQDHVTGPLQQALRSDRVNHAYLFCGPRGCGKTTWRAHPRPLR